MRRRNIAWIPLVLLLGCNDQSIGGQTITPEDLAPVASEHAQSSVQRQQNVAEEDTLQEYPPPDSLETAAQGPNAEPTQTEAIEPPGPPAQTLRVRMAPVIVNLCNLDRSIEVIPLDAEGGATQPPRDGLLPELVSCLTAGALSKGVVEVKAYPATRRPADKALADEQARALWFQEYLEAEGIGLDRIQTSTITHAAERLGDSTTEPTVVLSLAT